MKLTKTEIVNIDSTSSSYMSTDDNDEGNDDNGVIFMDHNERRITIESQWKKKKCFIYKTVQLQLL
eukprot:8560314-Ditylum_brightwellii.AAC.1